MISLWCWILKLKGRRIYLRKHGERENKTTHHARTSMFKLVCWKAREEEEPYQAVSSFLIVRFLALTKYGLAS